MHLYKNMLGLFCMYAFGSKYLYSSGWSQTLEGRGEIALCLSEPTCASLLLQILWEEPARWNNVNPSTCIQMCKNRDLIHISEVSE